MYPATTFIIQIAKLLSNNKNTPARQGLSYTYQISFDKTKAFDTFVSIQHPKNK